MSYTITITKKKSSSQTVSGPWGVIDKRPWTEEEFSKATADLYGRNDAEAFLKANPLKEVRGYLPTREIVSTVEIEVLKQTVETLDMAAVIKVINQL